MIIKTRLFRKIGLLSVGLLLNFGYSQSVKSYRFEDYKAGKGSTKTRAKINYSSNPTASAYRTRIRNGYKEGKIDFASYYITVTWGCGSACVSGAMIDTRDGKVYDLPLDESTYFYGCDLDEDFIFYHDFSRLFVSISCTEVGIENTEDYYLEKTYFINEWNEKKKKFILITTFKDSTSVAHK